MIYVIAYLIIINALGFSLMLIDKKKARKRARRIPEKLLLGVAIIGGSIGSLIGMYTLRHKTRHPQFKLGIPAFLLIQLIIVLMIMGLSTDTQYPV